MSLTSMQSASLLNALLLAASPVEIANWLSPTVALAPGAGGCPLQDGTLAVNTGIQLRYSAPNRRAVITVVTVDLTCTYTVTVTDTARGISETDTYNATTGAPADLAALLIQWKESLDASGVATYVDTAITDDGLTLTWKTTAATGLTVAQSSSAVLTVALEYETALARLYRRDRARVVIQDVDDKAAAETAIASWQPHADLTGEPVVLSLQFGQGWRRSALPVAGAAALAWLTSDLEGHADDGGSSSGVTVSYTNPVYFVGYGVSPAG